MPTLAPITTATVSRRELSELRFVWLTTGVMFLLLSGSMYALAFLLGPEPSTRLLVLGSVGVVIAFVLLRSEAPPIGSRRNHVVLATVWVMSGLLFWAYQPGGAAAIGAAMFIGPLCAVRLQDRIQIGAHFVAASLLFLLVGVFGQVNLITEISLLMSCLAMWVLGAACTVVLETSEAQGADLGRLVRRDPLTGVGNRRMLSERLRDELPRHARTGRQLSLLLFDLNGFKALNDAAGHGAGDDLLRAVGGALEATARPHDIVVRQGGDEFCLVLLDSSAQQALEAAEAVRAALAEIQVAGVDGVTTGVGIALFPEDASDGVVLLHVADERLRADKQHTPRRGAATSEHAPISLLRAS